jgi:hypothetical protein
MGTRDGLFPYLPSLRPDPTLGQQVIPPRRVGKDDEESLAWIQARMAADIAILYGHDVGGERVRKLVVLSSVGHAGKEALKACWGSSGPNRVHRAP